MHLLHNLLRANHARVAILALDALAGDINTFDEHGMTPMMILARKHYTNAETAHAFFSMCAERGGDVDLHNKDNRTALYHAVDYGSYYAVEALLKLDARTDFLVDDSYSIVHKAVLRGHAAIICLLAHHCPVSTLRMRDVVTGGTFLHDLVERDSLVDALQHVAAEENFSRYANARNHAGDTALMVAIARPKQNTTAIHALAAHNEDRNYLLIKR